MSGVSAHRLPQSLEGLLELRQTVGAACAPGSAMSGVASGPVLTVSGPISAST